MVARRTVVTTAAWAVPAVIVGAPAAAMTCSQATVDDIGVLPAGLQDGQAPWADDQISNVTGTTEQFRLLEWTLGAAPDNLDLTSGNFADAVTAPCPFQGTLGIKVTTEIVSYRKLANKAGDDVRPMTVDLMSEKTYRTAGVLRDYGLTAQANIAGVKAGTTDLNGNYVETAPGAVFNAIQAATDTGTTFTDGSGTPLTGTRIASGPHGYPAYQWEITATSDGVTAPKFHTMLRNSVFQYGNRASTQAWTTFKFIITIETSNGKKLTYTTPDI